MTVFITDIDGTLLGHETGLKELNDYLAARRKDFYLVYATGRCLEEYLEAMSSGMLVEPDAAIINTGADIILHKDGKTEPAAGWHKAIDNGGWDAQKVIGALAGVKGIIAQAHLSRYKVSYFTDPAEAGGAGGRVREAVAGAGIRAKVIISHRKFIDILPEKCDKGEAAVYLLGITGKKPEEVITAGDSENDLDLLLKFKRGIVVSNARAELKEQLKGRDLFFASCDCAAGLLEGLEFYLR